MTRHRAITASLLLFTSTALAEARVDAPLEPPPPVRNAAFMNLGDLLNGGVGIEYERGFVKWLGVSLGIGMRGFDGPFDTTGVWRTAASAELGVRFHLTGTAPGGFWLGPTVKGAALITKEEGPPQRPFVWGAGVALGYHFIVLPNFAFQLGGGLGVTDFGAGLVWEPRLRLGLGFVL